MSTGSPSSFCSSLCIPTPSHGKGDRSITLAVQNYYNMCYQTEIKIMDGFTLNLFGLDGRLIYN